MHYGTTTRIVYALLNIVFYDILRVPELIARTSIALQLDRQNKVSKLIFLRLH